MTYAKIILTVWCCISLLLVEAQVKGDEDKEMFNKAGTDRDNNAVQDALNGWWTASMKNHEDRIRWWSDAKFGMFIHWGIYSLPGGEWKGKEVKGYGEHLMRKERIFKKDYLDIARQFNPVKFNAEEWVQDAKNAGMRYFVITAKHHDGFAMYPSAISDFNIHTQTPFKRDPMYELQAACKKYGLKFGFYYSHAFDWEHPDAPGNDWEYSNAGGDRQLHGGTNWYNLHPELLQKAKQYVDQKAIPQIVELIHKYHPDILWFDTPHKLPLSENIRILEAIRKADPGVVINGRLVRSVETNFGDYKNTADRPAEFYPVTGNWEAIPTTNESYGYNRFDLSHKPSGHFIRLLAGAAAKGGNLLMNIGPMGDGAIDEKDANILKGIGGWMYKNGESIYGTVATPAPLQSWGVTTYKKGKLYLHVFDYPADGKLYVGGINANITKAYLLADKSKTLNIVRAGKEDWKIELPATAPDAINTVVVLEINEGARFDSIRYVAPNSRVTRMLAFDAILNGKGFGFGDGKTNRYYVDGWKLPLQTISWTFRNDNDAMFDLSLKYIVGNNSGGTYKVILDGKQLVEDAVRPVTKGEDILTKDIGPVQLKKGIHTLVIKPVSITKQELMRPLELLLIKK